VTSTIGMSTSSAGFVSDEAASEHLLVKRDLEKERGAAGSLVLRQPC